MRVYTKTNDFYQRLINTEEVDIAKLNLFFTLMPKGGDIHHHYSGTIYAETYLDWVKNKGWLINKCTLKIIKSNKAATTLCPALTVDALLADNTAYRKLLMLWSDKDYKNHFHAEVSPDTNFFNTFAYFGPISAEFTSTGLAIIKERAVKENVSYIETMLSQVGVHSADYFSTNDITALVKQLRASKNQQAVNTVLDKISTVLNRNNKFSNTIDKFLQKVSLNHAEIDDDNFTMRYQTYAVRVLDPVQVFTDLYSGYLAADKSPLVVGVNIVAPENNYTALSDYTLQMQMYNYLLNKYPKVNRSLHAGELTLGMVRPKDLDFHINQAMSIAQAQRIGHGVDIPYESDSLTLLTELKQKSVIEINLTSNQFILGVEKNSHPYQIYAAFNVPLVISTDDSGVSRNNLSNEYMLLASRYRTDYSQIKSYVYNSINYSFLNAQDKQRNIKILDEKFQIFEQKMAIFLNGND